jgi:hypothetical protein
VPDRWGVIKLSAIDGRLPDVQISRERYPTFRNGRPDDAIDRGTTWVCRCRIAGIVYNRGSSKRGSSKCGYCGRNRSGNEERTTPWGLPPGKNAWAMERTQVDHKQATSRKHRFHLPGRSVHHLGRCLAIGKSGILLVILRTVEYSWSVSYRTAAVAFEWVGNVGMQKFRNVMTLLMASGELRRIRLEADRIYSVWILGCISQDPANNSRTFLKKALQRR